MRIEVWRECRRWDRWLVWLVIGNVQFLRHEFLYTTPYKSMGKLLSWGV